MGISSMTPPVRSVHDPEVCPPSCKPALPATDAGCGKLI